MQYIIANPRLLSIVDQEEFYECESMQQENSAYCIVHDDVGSFPEITTIVDFCFYPFLMFWTIRNLYRIIKDPYPTERMRLINILLFLCVVTRTIFLGDVFIILSHHNGFNSKVIVIIECLFVCLLNSSLVLAAWSWIRNILAQTFNNQYAVYVKICAYCLILFDGLCFPAAR